MAIKSYLQSAWDMSSEEDRLDVLRNAAIPFIEKSPIAFAKQALLNLTQDEWQDVCDWLSENHWLPPGN